MDPFDGPLKDGFSPYRPPPKSRRVSIFLSSARTLTDYPHRFFLLIVILLLISRMPGTGRERRDEAADVDRDNGRRNTGQVTTR